MQQVIDHLASEGYVVKELIADGKMKRFPLDSQDKKNSGFYVLHQNFLQDNGAPYYNLIYGDWRTGDKRKWCSLNGKLPASQARSHKEQFDRANREAEEERAREHEAVAKQCVSFWEGLEVTGASAYLDKKKVAGHALGIRYREVNGCIYIPVSDIDGKMWSLEEINAEGKKLAWPGGRKAGNFHLMGQLGYIIYLAEGFSTAASIYLAMGSAVCTFGIGNFKSVAKLFHDKYPEKKIIICGDLNTPNKKSESEKIAELAAKSIVCSLIFPTFKEGSEGLTDFNDLHCSEGLGEVKRQLTESTTALVPVTLSGPEIVAAPFPDQDDKGKRVATIENLLELSRRLNVIVRYNGISKKQEILIPNLATSVDNRANVNIAWLKSWCNRCRIPTTDLKGFLTALAERNLYNPVATWIESEPWDGKSRLAEFYETIHAPNDQLKEKLIRYWLISAVAAAYEVGGISAAGMLVLQGVQYIGKTRWFRKLCPADLRLDGFLLRPDEKDSVSKVIAHWLVELGELDATFGKSDISQLKAFVSNDKDIIRRPYAECDSEYARRTVLMASVNDETFLNDPTGNRRFWTVACDRIEPDHSIDMQQLWAEVLSLYRMGERWWLSHEENAILTEHNKQFESVDPIEELIRDYYGWGLPDGEVVHMPVSATQVCVTIGITNPRKSDSNAAARALRKLSGKKPDHHRKQYWVPLRRERASSDPVPF